MFIYGGGIAGANLFIVIILLALIQYDGQNLYKVTSVGLIALQAIVSTMYLEYHSPEVPLEANPLGNITIFIASIFIAILMISFHQNNIKSYEQLKVALLDQLKLKNAELERFAYITSHDLKEPVRNIGGFSGLLRRKLSHYSLESNELELLREIEGSARRMSNLIDSILKFSKLDQEDIQKERIDLNEVLHTYQKQHQHLIQFKNVQFQYGDLPVIYGNKIYINLLFQNLIENSIKYNTSVTPLIEISGEVDNNQINVNFTDNGIGIDQQFAEYIFEPFRRLQNRKDFEGTGLGLAICKKIVNSHRGNIYLHSSSDNGSTFRIEFPNSFI